MSTIINEINKPDEKVTTVNHSQDKIISLIS